MIASICFPNSSNIRSRLWDDLRYPILLVTALLLVGFGGCARGARPSVAVVDAIFLEQSDEATVLDFVLRASNEQGRPIPLREFHYTLDLDGTEVFSSRRAAEVTLRGYGSQVILLPVVIRHAAEDRPLSGGHRYRFSGRLTFLPAGEITGVLIGNGVKGPSVRFEQSGELQLPESP